MALNLTPSTLQTKNVALTMEIAGQLYEVFARTSANNVIVDKTTGETLRQRLAAISAVIGEGGSVDDKIETAVNAAISKIVDSAPETFDTLKEIADFIAEHKTEFQALSALATTLTNQLEAEIARAKAAEATLNTALNNEVTRATAAEAALTTALEAEITRAKAAEKANTEKLEELVPAEAAEGAVLTRNAEGANVWEKVLKVIDVEDETALAEALTTVRPGQLGAVVLMDDPQGYVFDAQGNELSVANVEDFLTAETPANGTLVLQDNIVIPANKTVTFAGTIDLNGKTLEVQ